MADAIAAMKEDQARKARELAEKCFLAGNVRGARQWIQSAARLAPALPGTAQIVAAYDVHAAAASKRRTPDSWYAVLGLQKQKKPGTLTHDEVKRQHRGLCLLVHPDKNPSAAADGAFKLIQAAWDALSARHPPAAAKQPPPPAAKQPPPPAPPAPQPAPPSQQAPPPKPKWRPRPRHRSPPPRPRPTPRQQAPPPRPRRTTPKQQPTRQKPPEEGWQSSPVPPTCRRSTSPTGNKCPACGACTINSRRLLRCGSCQWSPMDDRPAADDDDDFEEDYY